MQRKTKNSLSRIRAIEQANKKRLLAVDPKLDEKSVIYI